MKTWVANVLCARTLSLTCRPISSDTRYPGKVNISHVLIKLTPHGYFILDFVVKPKIRAHLTLVQENDPLRLNYFPAHFREMKV